MAQFNKFDICEAHYLYARHYHMGGDTKRDDFVRLNRLHFSPGASLSSYDAPEEALTENGAEIYYLLAERGE